MTNATKTTRLWLLIDRVSTLIIAFVCVGVAWTYAADFVAAKEAATGNQPEYSAGEEFQPIPGLSLDNTRDVLILAISPTCKFCIASLDFYKEISALPRTGTTLAVVTPVDTELVRTFLGSGVLPDRIVQTKYQSTRFKRTPTILLVGRDGRIKKTWIGKLTKAQEQEVRNSLQGTATPVS